MEMEEFLQVPSGFATEGWRKFMLQPLWTSTWNSPTEVA